MACYCPLVLLALAPAPLPAPPRPVRVEDLHAVRHLTAGAKQLHVRFLPDGHYSCARPGCSDGWHWSGTWYLAGDRVHLAEVARWVSQHDGRIWEFERYHTDFRVVRFAGGVLDCEGWLEGAFRLR